MRGGGRVHLHLVEAESATPTSHGHGPLVRLVDALSRTAIVLVPEPRIQHRNESE